MADNHELNDVELASAYLDGEASADERARVEGDPALLAHVERLRQVRAAVGEVPPAPPATRDTAILAALATFDELRDTSGPTEQPVAPANVVPLERQRRVRRLQATVTAVAAASVLVVGGFVIANRGDDDDATTAAVPRPAAVTAQDESVAIESTPLPAPTSVAAPTTSTTSDREAENTAGELDVAAAPTAAAQTEMATAESASDATGASAAAPAVLHDADELHDFAESLDDEPPPDADVIADCEREPQAVAFRAVFEDVGGAITPVAVASTANGYAAVSLDDCTIVVRSP